MFDFFVGIAIGYFLRSLLVQRIEHDKHIYWYPVSLGWRSVPQGTRLRPGRRYIAAVEIKPENENS